MAAGLIDHIRLGSSRPFEWGSMDCTSWACDWVRSQSGKDPLEPWRGRYSSGRDYLRFAVKAGGIEELYLDIFRDLALIEPSEAVNGDVGLIMTSDGPGCSLHFKGRWFAKVTDGLVIASVVQRAWRTPSCQS